MVIRKVVFIIHTIQTMCRILYFAGRMNKCRSKWLIIWLGNIILILTLTC